LLKKANARRPLGGGQENPIGSRAKNFLPPRPLHFLPARRWLKYNNLIIF